MQRWQRMGLYLLRTFLFSANGGTSGLHGFGCVSLLRPAVCTVRRKHNTQHRNPDTPRVWQLQNATCCGFLQTSQSPGFCLRKDGCNEARTCTSLCMHLQVPRVCFAVSLRFRVLHIKAGSKQGTGLPEVHSSICAAGSSSSLGVTRFASALVPSPRPGSWHCLG